VYIVCTQPCTQPRNKNIVDQKMANKAVKTEALKIMKNVKLTNAEIFEKVVGFTEHNDGCTIAHLKDGSEYVMKQSIGFITQCYGYWLNEQGMSKIMMMGVPLPDVEKTPEMSMTDWLRKSLKATAEAYAKALGITPKNPKFFDELSDYEVEQLWAEAKYKYDLEQECTSSQT